VRGDKTPAALAVAGVGVLAVVGTILALTGDDDASQTRRVDTPPDRKQVTTTVPTFLVTTSSTTVTLAPTVPTTALGVPSIAATPGSIVVNPAPAPTAPAATPTAPAGPSTQPTTTSTLPKTLEQELGELLEQVLAAGAPAPPGTLPRVAIDYEAEERLRVTWSLDPTLTGEPLRIDARVEAAAMLQAIQGFARLTDELIVLRATLPDVDGEPERVLRLAFERPTLDAIDFATLDELTIFELADEADVDPILLPTPTTTSTPSSTTTTRR
jgi:hypothetical protein